MVSSQARAKIAEISHFLGCGHVLAEHASHKNRGGHGFSGGSAIASNEIESREQRDRKARWRAKLVLPNDPDLVLARIFGSLNERTGGRCPHVTKVENPLFIPHRPRRPTAQAVRVRLLDPGGQCCHVGYLEN